MPNSIYAAAVADAMKGEATALNLLESLSCDTLSRLQQGLGGLEGSYPMQSAWLLDYIERRLATGHLEPSVSAVDAFLNSLARHDEG